jgi:hypothetical protein
MKNHLYLYIIWGRFYNKKNIIIKDLEENYTIREIYEIKWTDKFFLKNLSRFYGSILSKPEQKVELTGKGPFLLILITDPSPKLEKKALDDVNLVEFNSNVLDSKIKYRKLIGTDSSVHCSISDQETNHDLALLLGKTSQDLEKELPKKWDGIIKKIENHTLTGHNGWKNTKQFFDVLNVTTNYVVLRNFEDLPDKILHPDIDILTDDVKNMSIIVNEENQEIDLPITIGDHNISVDFRYQMGKRYDEKWAKDVLKRRIMYEGRFYVPCKEDYFYTLFYHNIGNDSKEYEKILIQLALEIGINENIVQVLNDDIKSKEFLKKYLTKMGYKQTNTKSRIGYKISHTETIRLVKVSIFLLNTYGIKFFLKKMIIKLKNSI